MLFKIFKILENNNIISIEVDMVPYQHENYTIP